MEPVHGVVEPKHVQWVEDAVKENPFDLKAHLSLLAVLTQAGMAERLEAARRVLVDTLPVSEAVWLPWMEEKLVHLKDALKDDAEQARTVGEDVVALMRRAVTGCPWSPSLWKLYTTSLQIMSMIAGGLEGYGFDDVRAAFEWSVQTLGHSPSDGAGLWKDFIDFEEEMCTTLTELGHDTRKQEERIRSIYSQALSSPLKDHRDLWEEYVDWEEDQQKVAGVEKRKMVGEAAFALRSGREARFVAILADANASSNWDAFQEVQEYLAFEEGQLSGKKEKGKRNVSSGVCLFERALSVYQQEPTLWLRYFTFLHSWGGEERVLGWARRAFRHCPWNGSIQATCARAFLSCGQAPEAVQQHLEAALSGNMSGADDFHAVYSALEDLFPEQCERYIQLHEECLRSYFADSSAHLGQLLEYKAGRAGKTGDMDEFQKQWEAALKSYGTAQWEIWSRYIFGAIALGLSPEVTRSLFKRCVNLVQDAPEASFSSWQTWERLHGSGASILDSQVTVEKRARAVALQRAQWQRKHQTEPLPKKGVHPAQTDQDSLAIVDSAKDSRDQDKLGRTLFVKNLAFELDEQALKDLFASVGEVAEVRLTCDPVTGKSRGFAFVEFHDKEAAEIALTAFNGRPVMDRPMFVSKSTSTLGDTGSIPLSTLYVTNLPYDGVEDGHISSAFEVGARALVSSNPIRSIRILKASDGKSKGGAFVEFKFPLNPDVLKLDGILQVKGRPMKVEFAKAKTAKKEKPLEGSKAIDAASLEQHESREPMQKRAKVDLQHVATEEAPKKQEDAPGVTYDDSRTVFVGSIAPAATEDALRQQMETLCGPVISIRMVKGADGNHRGKAYVDFASEESREKALALSGRLAILDHAVLISQPKPREKGKSLKGTGFDSHAPPKPVSSLVPSHIARLQMQQKKRRDATPGHHDGKPKTQADFKAMFK